jgi:hypothetical protein
MYFVNEVECIKNKFYSNQGLENVICLTSTFIASVIVSNSVSNSKNLIVPLLIKTESPYFLKSFYMHSIIQQFLSVLSLDKAKN